MSAGSITYFSPRNRRLAGVLRDRAVGVGDDLPGGARPGRLDLRTRYFAAFAAGRVLGAVADVGDDDGGDDVADDRANFAHLT